MQTTALTVLDSIDVAAVQNTLSRISSFQATVKSALKKGQDYDVIEGTGGKPTLLKPGAEKITMMFGVNPEYDFIQHTEDFEKGFFSYDIKCTLFRGGFPVAQGVGNCNSMEKKYRWINVREDEIPNHLDIANLASVTDGYGKKKYKIPNPDIHSLVNTILKMAKKRAFVDATLQLASLSDVFTQDLEDMREFTRQENEAASKSMTAEQAAAITLTFGKYKGLMLGEIVKRDESYADWLRDNAREANVRNAAKILLSAGKASKQVSNPEDIHDDVPPPDDDIPHYHIPRHDAPPPDDDMPYYDPDTGEMHGVNDTSPPIAAKA